MYFMSKAVCPECNEMMMSEDIDTKTKKFFGDDSMTITEYGRRKANHESLPECWFICPKCGYVFEGSEVELMDRLDDLADIPW